MEQSVQQLQKTKSILDIAKAFKKCIYEEGTDCEGCPYFFDEERIICKRHMLIDVNDFLQSEAQSEEARRALFRSIFW